MIIAFANRNMYNLFYVKTVINGIVVDVVQSHKYPGVMVDDKLRSSNNVKSPYKKIIQHTLC